VAGGVALLWALADSLWLGGALQQLQRQRAERHSLAVQQQAADAEINALSQEIRQLGESQQQQIAAARQRAAQVQQELLGGPNGLVGAQQMLPLLQQLLRQQTCAAPGGSACAGKLRVRSVKSLQPVLAGANGAASAPAGNEELPGLWKHGVEIVLEGSYVDIANYVQGIEQLPQRLLPGGMSYQVERHPRSALTLRLYTLSLDKSWLEI
jgi:MSHA biogenesis protein MshJ